MRYCVGATTCHTQFLLGGYSLGQPGVLIVPFNLERRPPQAAENTETIQSHKHNKEYVSRFTSRRDSTCIEKKAGASSLTLWWEQGFPSSSQTTLCISGWCRIWSMLSHLFWQFTFLIHSCQLLHSKPHQLDPIKSPSFPTCKIKQLSCLRAWFLCNEEILLPYF